MIKNLITVAMLGMYAEMPPPEFDPEIKDYVITDMDFKKGGSATAGIVHKAHKPQIRVCLRDDAGSTTRKTIIRRSVLKWLRALDGVAKHPIATQVEITEWDSDDCDMYFAVGNYSPAYTNMGRTPTVHVAASGWYGSETVILHELGHAAGLLDTYNGRGGSCQYNQPDSVMCWASYRELQEDDKLGIQAVYLGIFGR